MADQALPYVLNATNFGAAHYDKIKDPLQRRIRKMRGQDVDDKPHPDTYDHRAHDDKGMVLRKRSEVASDEEVVETVRHRGQVLDRAPNRPRGPRRTSSMEGGRRRGAGGYDSEGSVPPKSRVRPKSESGRSKKRDGSSSSSELCSSTDDAKKVRKMQRKKWVTAALASVATIHAASKVYSSIESHDKRIIQVEKGEMSPEEAHKKQRQARWQDAAAIGIAALGIKGALSEWNEVQEEHQHHREAMKKQEEHHRKRMERLRRERGKDHHGYYKGRDGNWYYDGEAQQNSERSRSSFSHRMSDWDDGGTRNGDMGLHENGGRNRSRARSTYERDYSPDNDRDRRRDHSRRRRDDDRY